MNYYSTKTVTTGQRPMKCNTHTVNCTLSRDVAFLLFKVTVFFNFLWAVTQDPKNQDQKPIKLYMPKKTRTYLTENHITQLLPVIARDKFIYEQKKKIIIRNGASTIELREYFRQLSHAVHRVPIGQDVNHYTILVFAQPIHRRPPG